MLPTGQYLLMRVYMVSVEAIKKTKLREQVRECCIVVLGYKLYCKIKEILIYRLQSVAIDQSDSCTL